MHDKLLNRINAVTRRLRAVRRWQLGAIVAFTGALIGIALLSYAESHQRSGTELALGLLIGTGILFIIVALLARSSYRNPRQVASQIESRYPDLDQRLLTALSQTEDKQQPLGYLQQRVFKEVRDHARSHAWGDVVPERRLKWSRILGIGATGFWAVVLGLLMTSHPAQQSQAVASRIEPIWKVVVEPGNTEVERGSSLVITARFSGLKTDTVPSEAELICTAADGSERRIAMKRNLADPVVGGFLASVDQEITYQIVGVDWQSERYQVDVFEFPAVVRSDAYLDYPEYTGLADKRVEDTVRVSAVEGTRVKWICFVNKPESRGELVAKDGERITLHSDADNPGALSAEIDLQETERFTVKLIDNEGRENKHPPELIARVLANRPPDLKLAVARDVSVSPLEELPIAAEVRDDFGVTQIGLTYLFADQPPQDVTLAESIGRGEKKQVDHLVEFEKLGAEPDQLLSYYFWADDIGPDGQPRRTQSDLYFAAVRPFEEIYREGEPPPGGQSPQSQQASQSSQNAEQAQELAELQKEIINATWTVVRREGNNPPTKDFSSDVLLLMESQAQAIEMLEDLAETIQDPQSEGFVDLVRKHMQTAMAKLTAAEADDVPEPLAPAMVAEQAAYGALLNLRSREFEVVQSQQQQQQSSSSSSAQQRQQQLDELELEQDENRYETQQQAQETQAQEEQREVRQVLNRLRELARRQEDLNKQLAQLQSALEQADTEQEREEVERQLKRLREQQQDLLRETDELAERMQQPENQETMQEASEKLEQTRENVRQAAEALQQSDAAGALTSGKRAEREFEEMRDEFRQRAAGEFNDSVREMRNEAQELSQQQEQLAEQLEEVDQNDQPGLRSGDIREQILDTLEDQEERLGELLQQMQETVEEAELAEPLLAQKLYDSYRRTKQRQIEERLQGTSELLDRGFDPQAREFQREAGEGIEELRKDLEDAAESVLGDETEALQRALGELERLSESLDEEIDQSTPDRSGPTDAQQQDQQNGQPSDDGATQPGGEPSGQPSEAGQRQATAGQQPQPGEASDSGERQPPGDNQPPGQARGQEQGQGSGQTPGDPAETSPAAQRGNGGGSENRSQGENEARPNSEGRGEGGALSQYAANTPGGSPLTGDGFQDWSDRLRDVEEMVDDPELRSQAARIRDRAREVRLDFRRHSQEPQWSTVEKMIAEPLRELKRDVAEELVRRSAEKHAPVPIDRDPVPAEFTEAVRQYYESLGSGN